MFLLLAKTLDVLAAPLTWAMLLLLAGLAIRRARSALAAAALAVLILFSFEPVAGGLASWMESAARPSWDPAATYDAVIVLGGMVDPAASARSGELELMDSADRITRTAALLRTNHARAVLISGGLIKQRPGEPSEAERLAGFLREDGVEPGRIVIEDRSRNTHENAVESAKIVAAHGWTRLLLVTSAWHAPRAIGCFRRAGLRPDLLPVDHRATDGSDYGWFPRAGALSQSTDMLRELLGRIVYRAVGYSG